MINENSKRLMDEDTIIKESIDLVNNEGIVFLYEIYNLLPLLEGTTVSIKYGTVKTDYILFIASGAFHLSKLSDILPELQSRLQIRVELKKLTQEDLI